MAETYDYREAVLNDLENFIRSSVNLEDFEDNLGEIDKDKAIQEITDMAVNEDCVSGNMSGSYWCNRVKAEECLAGNMDLLADAIGELELDGGRAAEMLRDPEGCDVTIRFNMAYGLVPEALDNVLDELEEIQEAEGRIMEDNPKGTERATLSQRLHDLGSAVDGQIVAGHSQDKDKGSPSL